MAAERYDLIIEQGTTWSLQYTVSGDLTDLTGYAADLQIRRGASLVAACSTTDGSISISTATLTATLTDTITAALAPGLAEYDHFIESSGGVRTRLLYGQVKIVPRVTT